MNATGTESGIVDALLQHASLDDAARHRWHKVFERQNRDAHGTFLLSLGIQETMWSAFGAKVRQAGQIVLDPYTGVRL